ncbi:isoprenylcysteine carboxylmethyltransferase family protein [Saccharopolyspora sp. NPDC047091]|uniref:methyltransferase family protein n=1 Tax=Saccharopolyspora sp. NPDC047091 TaxID=3155924 RepID=UPI00340712D9
MNRKLESLFPPAIFLCGMLVLAWGIGSRLLDGATGYGEAAVLLAYLAWTLVESRVTFQGSVQETSSADRGSLQLYGLSRLAVLAAVALPPNTWDGWGLLRTGAVAVFFGGVVLRLTAVHRLGRFYSHRVRTVDGHAIVSTGPYRLVRHPAYTGMVFAHLGLVAAFLNPYGALAFAALMVPAVVRRILVEEDTLMRLPDYPDYARDRRRLIPAVW